MEKPRSERWETDLHYDSFTSPTLSEKTRDDWVQAQCFRFKLYSKFNLHYHLRCPILFDDLLFNLLLQKTKPKPKPKAKAKPKPGKSKSKSKKESEEEESEEEEEESEDVDMSDGSDSDWSHEVPRRA